MGGVLEGLRGLGVAIEPADADRLPFTVHGRGGVAGGAVAVDASASSQFVSGLLLSGARYDAGLTVTHRGPGAVPSLPHVEMTVEMLRAAGVEVTVGEAGPAGRCRPGRSRRPPATSSSPTSPAPRCTSPPPRSPAGRSPSRAGPPSTTRPAGPAVGAVRGVLEAFGGTVTIDDAGLTVPATASSAGVDVDLPRSASSPRRGRAGDRRRAAGPSRLRGVAHIRGHETDRLAALATEAAALGAGSPRPRTGSSWSRRRLRPTRPWGAYADHRMATAGALVGLVVPGVEIDDVTATTKTLPDFATDWPALVHGVGNPGVSPAPAPCRQRDDAAVGRQDGSVHPSGRGR